MKRWLPPVLFIVGIGAGLFFFRPSGRIPMTVPDGMNDSAARSGRPATAVSSGGSRRDDSAGPISGFAPGPVEAGMLPVPGAGTDPGKAPPRVSYAPDFTNIPPDVVLENMRLSFRSYAAMFHGNPIGTNPEITAALNGGNPKQARFIREEDGLRVNARGELVDPWGTPFFFHQLSANDMEIHCAGPDREMWTDDDLVSK